MWSSTSTRTFWREELSTARGGGGALYLHEELLRTRSVAPHSRISTHNPATG